MSGCPAVIPNTSQTALVPPGAAGTRGCRGSQPCCCGTPQLHSPCAHLAARLAVSRAPPGTAGESGTAIPAPAWDGRHRTAFIHNSRDAHSLPFLLHDQLFHMKPFKDSQLGTSRQVLWLCVVCCLPFGYMGISSYET